ncbi:MAG TPA: N-acetylmuramoyl-L-alanine amidase [Accumulibacter sp.]|nr:N-acetylmuramoyl-L-alanine amidase [Accumulibacter sp.]HPP46509.1 N-acetylmuramoyl-L-alanine amidase [Accumulibacter sp.]
MKRIAAAGCRAGFCAALLAGAAPAAQADEVAVDVGHGLRDQGAISARGKSEYRFNDRLARRLADELATRGLTVRRINFDGRIESLPARPQQAAGADFFISIHHDSVQPHLLRDWQWQGAPQTYSDEHAGFALFVSHANPDLPTSLLCASAIGARLRRLGFTPARHHADPTARKPRQPADTQNAVYYYDNLIVLYRTSVPALLFEAGVIKNRAEELLLEDAAYQRRMVDAMATGIAACLFAGT